MEKQKIICILVPLLILNFSFTNFNCSAQLTVLKTFNDLNGAQPFSKLFYNGTYLYGATFHGGITGQGTIFRIKLDGTEDSTLLNCTNANFSYLEGSLISDGTYLYGTSVGGGTYQKGAIYRIRLDGTMDTVLYSLNNNLTTSCWPIDALFYDGVYLYGTSSRGGTNDNGFIFKIKTDGTGYTELLYFNGANGFHPSGSLISDGTYLYGTTENGGLNGKGTIFRIMPDGTGYTLLLNFNGINGSYPDASFLFDGTYLYGTTSFGGTNNAGTVFKIKPDGTGFTLLVNFTGSNGFGPRAELISDGTYFYGTTVLGGINNKGTIFRIKPDGTGFTVLFHFNGPDGNLPSGALFYDGTYFYGTTQRGGSADEGVVYKLCITPVTFNQSFVICQGGSTSVGINTYTANGTYVDHLSSFHGCDSIVTTQLTVLPTSYLIQTISKCSGDSVTVGSHTYTISGTYTDSFSQEVSGCDSIIITNLNIFNGDIFQSPTLCALQNLTVGIHTYSENGTYKDTLTSKVCTCDSIITTNLTVLPVNVFQQSYVICAEDSLTVGTHIYVNNGIYIDTLTSKVYDCDSIVITNLNVLPANIFIQSDTVYSGNSLVVGTNVYNSSGTYIDEFISFKGCDSTVITNLFVNSIDLKISPNPSMGQFNFTNMEEGAHIKIYDLIGRLVFQAVSEGNEYILDLSHKCNGIYLYKVIGANSTFKGKLIKQ